MQPDIYKQIAMILRHSPVHSLSDKCDRNFIESPHSLLETQRTERIIEK